MFRGDFRYADRLGDFGSDAYFNAERAAAQADLAALRAIDRNALTADRPASPMTCSNINREDALEDLTPEMLALTAVRPINHFSGFHTFYPGLRLGAQRGAVPQRPGL